jgi:hypothetical protein
METTSLDQRRRRVPAPVVDAGLAVATALAVAVAIRASPEPSGPPEWLAYLVGSTIAALTLVRRRWPLAVLLVSAATLQLYYVLDFPGIFPAVPLAVALFTAWAAGHRGWSLLVTAWFVAAPVAFRTLVAKEAPLPVLSDAVRDAALFAAVLLLGEAVRARAALDRERQRSERLLLNVLPASIAARLKQSQGVIADGFPDVTVLFADIVNFTPSASGSLPRRSSSSWTSCSRPSTNSLSATGWRRSRPSGTPTWWLEGCPTRVPTTPRPWPTWLWPCARRSPGTPAPAVGRSRSASASTPARWWPA